MTNKVATTIEKWTYRIEEYMVIGEIVLDTGRKQTLVKNTLLDGEGELVGECFTVSYGAGMAAVKAMKARDISKNIRMADRPKQLAFDL